MKTTLVIMAAGIGSRFGGGIKQLAPVGLNGEIIMDYSIHDAIEAGFNKIVFIIEYSCAMKSHFRKFGNQSSGTRKSPILCLMTYPFLLGYLSRPCRICGA